MDSISNLPADVVSSILTFARKLEVSSAHYIGNADRSLIKGLSEILGNDAVSIIDIPDRWKTGFAFFWDEHEFPNTPCPECPNWLKGITSYQEGGPNLSYLLIQDTPWNHRLQLRNIVEHKKKKNLSIPGIVLIGEAREVSIPEDYEYNSTSDCITLIRRI